MLHPVILIHVPLFCQNLVFQGHNEIKVPTTDQFPWIGSRWLFSVANQLAAFLTSLQIPFFLKVHPHYAARQNATHCTVCHTAKVSRHHVANLIISTLKKISRWLYFRLQKLQNEKRVFFAFLVYICIQKFWNPLLIICRAKNDVYTTVDDKYWRGKPLMSLTLCQLNFHDAACRSPA